MQFTALANHLPQLGSVIGEGGERVRQALRQILVDNWDAYHLQGTGLTPDALLFLLSAIPRMMHLEASLGTITGHTDTLTLVEGFLDRVEPPQPE